MACYHPLRAWRLASGAVVLREPPGDPVRRPLRLPCGNCIGCRTSRAKHWALRCNLELQQHDSAAFATLTYAPEYCPPTLRKADLSAYLKRLREDVAPVRFRFFASGEYGDRFDRPHYHAILFGLHHQRDKGAIVNAWGLRGRSYGIVDVAPVTPRVISYVAGYCSKKLGWKGERRLRVDPDTGEEFLHEPPFVHMSRGGTHGAGIGAAARDAHPQSWRKFAVVGGAQVGVPRYLHDGWRRAASDLEREALELEKAEAFRVPTREELDAGERNALARHKLAAQRRSRK